MRTFETYFENQQVDLSQKINQCLEAHEIEKLIETVKQFFSEILDENSDNWQILSDSERYILKSIIAFKKADSNIWSNSMFENEKESSAIQSSSDNSKFEVKNIAKYSFPAGVAFAGSFINPVASAVGAIIGTALSTAMANNKKSISQDTASSIKQDSIDGYELLKDIRLSCVEIDNIIKTVRAQLSVEQPTEQLFESKHRILLEKIQTIVGLALLTENDNDQYLDSLLSEIRVLQRSLLNENLEVVNCHKDSIDRNLFEFESNRNVSEIIQILPAIVKNNTIVCKGRVLTPLKSN